MGENPSFFSSIRFVPSLISSMIVFAITVIIAILLIVTGVIPEESKSSFYGIMTTIAIIGAPVTLIVVYFVAFSNQLKILHNVREHVQNINTLDFKYKSSGPYNNEVGFLADELNQSSDSLNSVLSMINQYHSKIKSSISKATNVSERVCNGLRIQKNSFTNVVSLIEKMIQSQRSMSDRTDMLSRTAEESSSSVMQMAVSNDQVAENIQTLSTSVEQTVNSIEQMNYSTREIAQNIDNLAATTEDTSSSMHQMDVTINQVETLMVSTQLQELGIDGQIVQADSALEMAKLN